MARLTILLLALMGVVLSNVKELNGDGGTADVEPLIISRQEWGARSPKKTITSLSQNPPGYVIIHHADTPPCESSTSCRARVKSIQNYQMDTKKWDDIGYNFLAGGDGKIYEGRGWGKRGAHSKPYNSRSIGICLIGNFSDILPNQAQKAAVQYLIEWGAHTNKIRSNYTLFGHRQTTQTDCPGDTLFHNIKTWPHWSADS